MNHPSLRLSVVLATYNGAKYLSVQLQSLAEQTRLPDELVVCDDGSKDDTLDIVRSFAARAPFPVIVHAQPANVGVHQNFSTAMTLASGDVIFCCDQDDRWHADKLARMAAVFEADPAVGLVLCDASLVNQDLSPKGKTLWQQWQFGPDEQARVEAGDGVPVFMQGMPVYGCTMAVRASLRDRFLPIPKGMSFDGWAGHTAALCAAVRLVREPLLDYRQHAAQVTGFHNESKFRFFLRVLRQHADGRVKEEVLQLETTLTHLPTLPPSAHRNRVEALAKQRLRLFRGRLKARQSLLLRVPLILTHLLNGSYHASAQGVRSAGVDLLAKPERLF